MSRTVQCRSLVTALAAALAAACGGTDTVYQVPACSQANPLGQCDAGSQCVNGTCVVSSTLCSPTNLTGACGSGLSCLAGGCVLTSAVCSSTNTTGLCDIGKTCLSGACVATGSLCSTVNTSGACPTGQTCQAGACAAPAVDPCTVKVYTTQPTIKVASSASSTPAGVITVDGLQFKDNSKDGKLDVYEDWRLSEICRAKDLASKLTAAEKIGLLGEGSTFSAGTALTAGDTNAVTNTHIRQALIRLGAPPARLAVYTNALQELAESQKWGIPVVLTSDPSHGFGMDTNASTGAQTLSNPVTVSGWPYPLGLGAASDVALTQQYGDVVRREFMGIGLRWQLGPMADIGTEPRWARVQNVFGENAYHVSAQVSACIKGFQGAGVGGLKNGIASTMKHFPGHGADQQGMDAHTHPGRYIVFPGNNFEYHQIAFQAAISAGAAAVMPCYGIFKGQTKYDPEQTGGIFSKGLVTDYLKTELGFDGMVTSDWGTLSSSDWGVETLTQPQRAAMLLHAGSHQLGSDSISIIQTAYNQGLVSDADLTTAAVKVLEMSFKLGIFENPYVDPTAAGVRTAANRDAGFIAQKKAIVILKNADHSVPPCYGFFCAFTPYSGPPKVLPISGSRTYTSGTSTLFSNDYNGSGAVEVYYDGVWDSITATSTKPDDVNDVYGDYDYSAAASGTSTLAIVAAADPKKADIAVVRISARKGTYFGLDAGVPLSFDAPFPGVMGDSGLAPAMKDRNRVIDLLRIRDGYTKSDGTQVAAANPSLKIVLVMHMDRPGIVKPFIMGLTSLDETTGVPGSYPLVSKEANISQVGVGGVDAFLVEFGAFDRAVLDVVFNKNVPTSPTGYAYGQARLPMEIPSSDAEVAAQYEDVPADTANPTFALGAGGSY
jgi:beta-glucosidase